MGDEIRDQNVVRITRDPRDGRWWATIGPDRESGLSEYGSTAAIAVQFLGEKMRRLGWRCDETWQPGKPGFHTV